MDHSDAHKATGPDRGTVGAFKAFVAGLEKNMKCKIIANSPVKATVVRERLDKYIQEYKQWGENLPNNCTVVPVDHNPNLQGCTALG